MIRGNQPNITVEVIDDPEYNRSAGEADVQFQRNSEWLASHWSDLLPQARGRFVAVAGGESHIADSAEEAWGWARKTHPNDKGPLVQYVRRETLPRIYTMSGVK